MSNQTRLTEAQRRLVEAPVDSRLLVTAPAGSGKTLSLIHRLAYLIDEEELEPSELLVLSFSRAAVREIRNRLTTLGSAAAHVEVRTFDSYATWLLSETAAEGPWQHQGYEQRIRTATRMIKEDPSTAELVSETRHLVVDEVQDLVGDRAELVNALLDADIEGFTLLGDPAQGIYGFQLADPRDRLAGAARLYSQVKERFIDDLEEVSLQGNFRAREPEARVALDFGAALGDVDAPFNDIQRRLRTLLLSGDSLGNLDQAAPVLSRMTAPTALVCRTNGDVLLISRRLHELGIPHRVQRTAQDKVIPSWASTLFRELGTKQPTKDAVLKVLGEAGLDPHEVWAVLRRMDRSHRGETLDLTTVRKRLILGDLPDEFVGRPRENLVVSTIHRVKGLEFDQVVLVDPGDAPDDDLVEQAERARLMYVAMTRPRDLLIQMKPISGLSKGYLKSDKSGRWAELGFKAGACLGVEVRPDDVNAAEPAGVTGFVEDPLEIQRYLAAAVRNGDTVSLVRADQADPDDLPRYIVVHDDRRIGVTTDAFATAMQTLLPGRNRRLPLAIVDLRIDEVGSVIGREVAGINTGLGWSGVWLRPRIMGLGRFIWA